MSKVQVIYKAGAVINLDVEEFKVSKTPSGDIQKLSWVSGKDRIAFLETDGLAAVIYK